MCKGGAEKEGGMIQCEFHPWDLPRPEWQLGFLGSQRAFPLELSLETMPMPSSVKL